MNPKSVRLDQKLEDIPKWNTKDNGLVPMSSLSDSHLQKAIIVTQKRQMRSLAQLELDERLEAELRNEAKSRNLEIIGLESEGNHLQKAYHQSKKILEGVFLTVKRRKKKLEKVEN